MKIITHILDEALSIEDQYTKEWSDIDKEIFDEIILLDSKTSQPNVLGDIARKILLPNIKKGEDISDIKDNIKACTEKYYQTRGTLPNQLKNTSNFPTIHSFVDCMLNGEESDSWKAIVSGITAPTKQEKENPIDTLYNSYYKEIDRDTFNKIIALDPDTTNKNIGPIAKNLLLRLYLKGDTDFLNKEGDVRNAIKYFNEHAQLFETEELDLNKYDSVENFIHSCIYGNGESSYMTYIKTTPSWKNGNIRYIGSTRMYDILEPLTYIAAAYIAGADSNLRDPEGRPGPGITRSGSVNYGGAGDTGDPSNIYGHWCTTCSNYWGDYRNGSDGSTCKYYNFMARGRLLTADHREHNYQLSIARDGSLRSDADGYEHYGVGNELQELFREDPTISEVLIKENEYASNMPKVKAYFVTKEYSGKPFIIDSLEDLNNLRNDENFKHIREVISEVKMADNITEIPDGAFANWNLLSKIHLPANLKRIGFESFKNCNSLGNIVLPDNLQVIADQAFQNCIKLHGNVKLPSALTEIGSQAFENTGDLILKFDKNHTKMAVSKFDRLWYQKHAQPLNTNEDVNDNNNKWIEKVFDFVENLNEEKLDENIPSDLLAAYRRSRIAERGIQIHPDSNHTLLGRNGDRKVVAYDYAHSNYEVLTPEQATQYLSLNAHVDTDEEGKYVVSARTTDREAFNKNICNLRFIIGGRVVEYEVRSGNRLYQSYYCNIPPENFGNYPRFKDKDGYNTTDSRWANKYSDVYTIINIADKIYKTDEYEHPIDRSNQGDSYEYTRGVEGNGRRVYTDTGAHGIDTRTVSPVRYELGYSDDSNYDKNPTKLIRLYTAIARTKENVYQEYNLWRRAIRKLIANKDVYDDAEYEEKLAKYKAQFETINKRYNDLAKEAKTLFNQIEPTFQETFIENYNEEKRRYLKLQEEIDAKSKLFRGYKDQLLKLSLETSEDSSIVQNGLAYIKEASSEIADIQRDINEREQRNEEIKRQIEQLQQALVDNQSDIDQSKEDLVKTTEKIEQAQAEQSKLAEIAVKANAEKSNKLQKMIDELGAWLDENTGSHYQENRPKERPLTPEQDAVLDFKDSGGTAEEYENKLCQEKFGVDLETVIKACNKYHELYKKGMVVRMNDMANPFWNDSDYVPLLTLNDVYKFQREVHGRRQKRVDDAIVNILHYLKTQDIEL